MARAFVLRHLRPNPSKLLNSYIREEDLGVVLGDLVKRVRIPTELADAVAKVLRESQSDKETFVRATTMRLQ